MNAKIFMIITGVGAAIAGYVTINTKLVFAYKGGTLANVHALCGSALVQAFGGPRVAGACSSIGAWYDLATVALWGGLLTAVAGVVLVLVQHQRPAQSEQGQS